MKLLLTSLLVFSLTIFKAQSEDANLLTVKDIKTGIWIGFKHNIHSEVLKEDRIINIYHPPGYDTTNINYPTIYVMDGSLHEDFLHIVGLVQFLTMYELMPETIVVGISNVDRKRDFTYPTSIEQDKIDFPSSGGSENFINFLKEEAIPFIDTLYRTNEMKTIIGQSLGGLLATEIFLKHTEMFNQYIIVSPSLWWDDESLLALNNPVLTQPTNVFVSVGKEGRIMQRDAKKLANKIQKVNGADLKIDFKYLPKENHATILHQAAYIGLRSIYEN